MIFYLLLLGVDFTFDIPHWCIFSPLVAPVLSILKWLLLFFKVKMFYHLLCLSHIECTGHCLVVCVCLFTVSHFFGVIIYLPLFISFKDYIIKNLKEKKKKLDMFRFKYFSVYIYSSKCWRCLFDSFSVIGTCSIDHHDYVMAYLVFLIDLENFSRFVFNFSKSHMFFTVLVF